MQRVAQLGIAIAALGTMISIMGLFPGVTGLSPTSGVGLVQLFGILFGFMLLMLGAIIYVKYAFYATQPSTLIQQIGTRLTLTGIVLAIMSGLSDALGFGSHAGNISRETFLGPLQALGIVGSYFMSAVGVLIYALGGTPEELPEEETTDIPAVDEDLYDENTLEESERVLPDMH